MGAIESTDMIALREAAAWQVLLDRAQRDDIQRLPTLETIVRRLASSGLPAEDRLDVLQRMRDPLALQWQRLSRHLMSAPQSQALAETCDAMTTLLREIADQYRACSRELIHSPGRQRTPADIGPSCSPLARALDSYAAAISLNLQRRLPVPPAWWDQCCVVARQLRSGRALDAYLLGKDSLTRTHSARGAFVYPIMLALAGIGAREGGEVEMIMRLARRLAPRTGVRIDSVSAGESDTVNRHGPTFNASPLHGVRLDTHRVMRSLAEFRERVVAATEGADLDQVPGLASALTPMQARRIMVVLRAAWGPGRTVGAVAALPGPVVAEAGDDML